MSKQTIIAWSTVGLVSLALAGSVAYGGVQTVQHEAVAKAYTHQTAALKTVKADRDAANAEATTCATASELWRKATVSEATAFSTFLGGIFTGRQLDLTAANAYVTQAKAAGCEGGEGS